MATLIRIEYAGALLHDQVIVSAYARGDYSMKVIADGFKAHYSTVSGVLGKAQVLDCKTLFPAMILSGVQLLFLCQSISGHQLSG